MNRILNGLIAWLLVILATLMVVAVRQRNAAGRPIPDGNAREYSDGEENLLLVNPTAPLLPQPPMEERQLQLAAAEPTIPALTSPPSVAPRRDGRTITAIIVHHSESSHGDAAAINQWHRERGWNGIGYHHVICNGDGGGDGEIQAGRDENVQGAHALGRNAESLGVCLIGRNHFTAAQRESLRRLLARLCRRHGIQPSSATIQRHHERCPGPGLNLESIVAELARE